MGFWKSLVLLPGMVVHEFAHVLGCLLTGTRVHKVKWFGTSEAFVKHDKPGALAGLIISLAPFVLGNVLGFWFLQQSFLSFSAWDFLGIVFFWFGASLVLLAFPSKEDAENAFEAFVDSYREKIFDKNSILVKLAWLITIPFVFIPLVLVLGFILLFNYAFFLRLVWAVLFIIIAAG
ncbi:hypothetical protein KKE06_02465 [Candidatus Micrarchaeota archaeon]|nr:hypothetical protein [Candidatus Micrarchaeota archaeon]MBU1930087.1 hypothetical protein [Candidatus Micrarchaeota archaeon]